MTNHKFYLENVYPQLDLRIVNKYPLVSLIPLETHHSLMEHSVVMLVALTGTGKSTTLKQLTELADSKIGEQINTIPSRREIADWIAIPMAQVLLGEAIQPVVDRVKRFHYTRTFAECVTGGMTTAFSWIQIADHFKEIVISEGIRGANELEYALTYCSNWQVIELALHPIIRLQRLSSRDDLFDRTERVGDVSFLPATMHDEANRLLETGEITQKALTIMQAESGSYGLFPYAEGRHFANYHCIQVDDLTPAQVAKQVHTILMASQHDND